MDKPLFLCLWTLLCLCSCTPKQSVEPPPKLVSINIIDRDGLSETISNPDRLEKFENVDFLGQQPFQKVLRVYQRDENGTVQAYITSYHENGQLRQYLEVANGRAFGLYREWYPNGRLKVEAHVIGGTADITMAAEKTWLFEGVSKAWDDNGNLLAEIPYSKGVQQGVALYYHSNGTLWKKVPYDKNELHGVMEVYLEDGTLLQTVQYYVGQREGPSIRYWTPTLISTQEMYQEGKLISGLYYNLCGELISTVEDGRGFRALFGKETVSELQEYRNGVLQGEVKVFGRNNKVTRIYHVKNGVKHGEEIEYYSPAVVGKEQQPKIALNWYEGRIQGIVKTWYDNGVQESQREMSNNAKNGLATAWYRDGNLMLIEEYDRDKLVRGEYYKRGNKAPATHVVAGKGTVTMFDAEGNFVRRIPYQNGVPAG
jgi:antitoxin component YwqK of YwqJK toxin-antitoxin module